MLCCLSEWLGWSKTTVRHKVAASNEKRGQKGCLWSLISPYKHFWKVKRSYAKQLSVGNLSYFDVEAVTTSSQLLLHGHARLPFLNFNGTPAQRYKRISFNAKVRLLKSAEGVLDQSLRDDRMFLSRLQMKRLGNKTKDARRTWSTFASGKRPSSSKDSCHAHHLQTVLYPPLEQSLQWQKGLDLTVHSHPRCISKMSLRQKSGLFRKINQHTLELFGRSTIEKNLAVGQKWPQRKKTISRSASSTPVSGVWLASFFSSSSSFVIDLTSRIWSLRSSSFSRNSCISVGGCHMSIYHLVQNLPKQGQN